MFSVRAIRDGYYGEVYRVEGDEFTLNDKADFSANWMVALDDKGRALASQPAVKGKKRGKDEAAAMADAALASQGARQAQLESVADASLGSLAKVVDVAAAADPDEPGISTKK